MKGTQDPFSLKYVSFNLLTTNIVLEKGVKVMLFTFGNRKRDSGMNLASKTPKHFFFSS